MILDSNIIIYSIKPEKTKLRDFLKAKKDTLAVSVISKLEVLGYHKITLEEKILFENFFQSIINFPINNLVLEKAIEIRQIKKISIGDSVIAATALLNNLELLTNNEDDFSNLSGLKIISMKTIDEKLA